MSEAGTGLPLAEARLLEEHALNASGAFRSILYDGWLLGYRPGATKRLRSINAHYPSTLPLAEKVAHCVAFYRGVGLPPLFRLLPFSQPPALDGFLERAGWTAFETTLVQHVALDATAAPALPAVDVDAMPVPAWVGACAPLLGLAGDEVTRAAERETDHPLPQVGMVVRRDGAIVACGLLKLEREVAGEVAGLFAIHTAPAHAGQGLGRAIVAALLAEARRRGARRAYLQVTAANAAAVSLYRRFGFATAYDYWYRRIDP